MIDRADWLPGSDLPAARKLRLAASTVAGAPFWVPKVTGPEAGAIAHGVRTAALGARRTHRLRDVISAVSAAACRLADESSATGAAALDALQRGGGFSLTAARDILGSNARGWTVEALEVLVRSEFPDPAVLEHPVLRPMIDPADPDRSGRYRRAAGPPLVLLVLAGNVPGVAVTAVIRSLLTRSGVLCKVPRDEPYLVGLFARALHEEAPWLAASVAATWWPADEPGAVRDTWIKQAGKVIVYGGASAVAALRRATPAGTPLIAYGPRFGLAILGPATTQENLRALARDVCAYDQGGCVSPRFVVVLGVPEGSTPDHDIVDRLVTALSEVVADYRPLWISPGEAIAIREVRAELQFADESAGRAIGPDDLAFTVISRPGLHFQGRALPRVVEVGAADGMGELRSIGSGFDGRIQTLAAAGLGRAERQAVEEFAVEVGVSRVTTPGDMAWPPVDWRHEGQYQLLPLVRWTDFEWQEGLGDLDSP